jgi:hypothetical protein
MNRVRTFFMTRALREKVLLVAFAALAVLIWGGAVVTRAGAMLSNLASVRAEHETQKVWLANAESIAARAAAATRSLDPAQTLNATRLVGELSSLAAQAGLTADIGSQRTDRTEQFAFHTVQVNFRRVDLPAILRFYSAMSKRAPYIALDQFSVATERTNPGQLNVSLRVVSVELAR